jgi:hypothetical protein
VAALAVLLGGCREASVGAGSGPRTPPGPTYPYVELADYRYTLAIYCFCPNAGVPIRVTVKGGAAVGGVYLAARDTVTLGEQSDDVTWLTLNDVIAAANDHRAYRVTVDWPKAQQWPDRVSVDPERDTVDEEYAYTVSDVDIG